MFMWSNDYLFKTGVQLQVLSNAIERDYVLTACKDGGLWVRKCKVSSDGPKVKPY